MNKDLTQLLHNSILSIMQCIRDDPDHPEYSAAFDYKDKTYLLGVRIKDNPFPDSPRQKPMKPPKREKRI